MSIRRLPCSNFLNIVGSCDGGFYLTDSVIAAAQFVCHEGRGTVTEATVLSQLCSGPVDSPKYCTYGESRVSMDTTPRVGTRLTLLEWVVMHGY